MQRHPLDEIKNTMAPHNEIILNKLIINSEAADEFTTPQLTTGTNKLECLSLASFSTKCCEGTTTLNIMTLSIKGLYVTLSIMTLSIIQTTFSLTMICHYAGCRYAECRVLFMIILNVLW
jgi:hypothetical protein